MGKQDSWKKAQEVEIDLAEFFQSLCVQWKQVAACAVLLAVLLGLYGYLKGKGNVGVQEESATEEVSLSAAEHQGITDAIDLENEILGLEEYLESSILMQIDASHKNKVVILYSIEQAKRQEVQKITESYLNFIINGGAADAIKKLDDKEWGIDKAYLSEILRAYQKLYSSPYQITVDGAFDNAFSTETLFYVEVTGKDSKMAQQLAALVQDALEGYYPIVSDLAGKHKLVLLSSESGIFVDSDLQTQQHNKKSLLSSNRQALKAMTDAFSQEQKVVYKQTSSIEEEQEKDEEKGQATGAGFGTILKYMLLGIAGGTFLYCGIYGCLYLFRDTIKSGTEMKRLYTFPFYGSIHLKGNAQKNLNVQNRIKFACKKQGITKLCAVAGFQLNDKEKGYMDRLAKQFLEFGIELFIIENADSNYEVWENMVKIGRILMVCRVGTTTHRMVDEEMGFYLENGITVAGAVAFVKHRG